MSARTNCGQNPDESRTPFGLCMDAVRTLDPTRPVPSRPAVGEGFSAPICSPSPCFSVQREVWHHLTAGLRMLSPNDYGRDWPLPRRDVLAELLAEFDDDLCVKAARETREIVCVQDRAPNITGLFAKKLEELAKVRSVVRESMGTA